ncbi:MAG: sugar phosphate isomerase/epimerase family protein [Pseudomonadota bacterium]
MTAITGVGLSTADMANTLPELGAALDWFETLGIDSVELSLANFEVVGGGRIWPDRLAELKRLCADRPFGYTVHGPISSSFADQAHLQFQIDTCRACLEVGQAVGATVQVHHAALLPNDQGEREGLLALERETLARLAPDFADGGVILCVETLFPHSAPWTASPSELAAQLTAVDHPNMRACIDFSHVCLNGAERGYDPVAEVQALAPLARHLHIHDSFARPKTFTPYSHAESIMFGLGDLHLPPGRGTLPWDGFAALPFAGPMVANLELISRHRDQIPAAIAWTRDWIARTDAAATA